MRGFVLIVWLISLAAVCGRASAGTASNEPTAGNRSIPPARPFTLTTQSKYPTVGLKDYVLITNDLERDRAKAEAVVQAKLELPRAMQTKRREDFERVLARNYTFRAPDEFFDRAGYIENRVGDPSKVKWVEYRNVVVQFIGDWALITYSNVVEDEPGGLGAWKADMTWADVLVKEDGTWKYETIHQIEFKDLTTGKQ